MDTVEEYIQKYLAKATDAQRQCFECYEKAREAYQKNEYKLALSKVEESIRLDQRFALNYLLRGDIGWDLNNDPQTYFDDSTKAFDLATDLGAAYEQAGQAASKLHGIEAGVKLLSEGRENDNRHYIFLFHKALEYLEEGKADEAGLNSLAIIKMAPSDLIGYMLLTRSARVHLNQKKPEDAVEIMTLAIDCKGIPSQILAKLYSARARAHAGLRDFERCGEDLNRANEEDEDISSWDFDCYLAKHLPMDKPEVRTSFMELSHLLSIIKALLFESTRDVKELFHYTTLSNLGQIATNRSFRLYNEKYLDDALEGNVFYDLLGLDDMERDKLGSASRSFVYIGSFTYGEPSDGRVSMWYSYGTNNGKKACGCALIWNREDVSALLPETLLNPEILESEGDSDSANPDSMIEDEGITFLKIKYEREIEEEKSSAMDLAITEMRDAIKRIDFNMLSNDEKMLIRLMLDQVRYFFKRDEYSDEHEVRVVTWRKNDSRLVKVDTSPSQQSTARFYVDTPLLRKCKRILFGPRVLEVDEWEKWLGHETGQQFEIEKSKLLHRS